MENTIINIDINMDDKCKCGRYGTVNNGLCLECRLGGALKNLKILKKNQKKIKKQCTSLKKRLYL